MKLKLNLKNNSCFIIFLILVIFLNLFIILKFNSNLQLKNDIYRIRVIANSNSYDDQNLKYQVAQNVLEYIDNKLSENNIKPSKIATKQLVKTNTSEILEIANNTINQNNFNYDVYIKEGSISYPTKEKLSFITPAGSYDSLNIVIGDGKGDNWWGLLFPYYLDLDEIKECNSLEQVFTNLDEQISEHKLVSNNEKEYSFKLLELFK